MELEIITYAEAKEQGLPFYFSGKPCKYNQVAPRSVVTRHCSCFICTAKQAYKVKNHYQNNKESISKRNTERYMQDKYAPRNPTIIKKGV